MVDIHSDDEEVVVHGPFYAGLPVPKVYIARTDCCEAPLNLDDGRNIWLDKGVSMNDVCVNMEDCAQISYLHIIAVPHLTKAEGVTGIQGQF